MLLFEKKKNPRSVGKKFVIYMYFSSYQIADVFSRVSKKKLEVKEGVDTLIHSFSFELPSLKEKSPEKVLKDIQELIKLQKQAKVKTSESTQSMSMSFHHSISYDSLTENPNVTTGDFIPDDLDDNPLAFFILSDKKDVEKLNRLEQYPISSVFLHDPNSKSKGECVVLKCHVTVGKMDENNKASFLVWKRGIEMLKKREKVEVDSNVFKNEELFKKMVVLKFEPIKAGLDSSEHIELGFKKMQLWNGITVEKKKRKSLRKRKSRKKKSSKKKSAKEKDKKQD